MKAAVKKEWVKALRSGEYIQSTGALKKENGFCCLGVLSDLYVKKHKKSYWTKNDAGEFVFVGAKGEKEASVLPYSVVQWSGVNEVNPYVKSDEHPEPLASLNDEEQLSFREIADLIEASL